ncbi:hypothetical protein CCACVL1_12370 [Corchorus capsularis]|uniref:Uncharacterized protein n=1 Tax=Corchorus capsularis TaxID=210143 RepID=A0A1R3IG49_COCAP|nr:hypothetical protein CCACVL1_12370 [Corchorus capsularis]
MAWSSSRVPCRSTRPLSLP